MTDKEIIKALEWLIFNFPKVKDPKTDSDKLCNCINLYCKNALDLINRKNEEIENLNIELKAMRGAANSYKAENERLQKEKYDFKNWYEKANFLLTDVYKVLEETGKKWEFGKHEAIKEFAERLKGIICDNVDRSLDNPNGHDYYPIDVCTDIDNLVKEMTGKGGVTDTNVGGKEKEGTEK